VRIEIVAVGTELLLGQIADTNGAWLGQELAAAGVSSHFHQAVGDNQTRIVEAFRVALSRSDGVIVCGGLGPTQDDITREAIAELMSVPLVKDAEMVERISEIFETRIGRMPANNIRQAERPQGTEFIVQTQGTAPGLICAIGDQVLYAVPGVPNEMSDMFERGILPDLRNRMARSGEAAVIVSRVLRTWGASESALAEALQGRLDVLDEAAAQATDAKEGVTIAFLASGMEGIKVRLTARAGNLADAERLLDEEQAATEAAILAELGDIVFGIDDDNMERSVAKLLIANNWTLGLAESLTGGLIASRLVDVPGASSWFRGAVVSYGSDVKHDLLGVPTGPVVSEAAAKAMALGARSALGADIGLAVTGVAGPTEQDSRPVGTVFVGLALPDGSCEAHPLSVPGDRLRVRQRTAITALDILRRELLSGTTITA
jgi:nicotinamide-nucleotide amidase